MSEPAERSRRGASALIARVIVLGAIAALPLAFSAWIDPARLVASRQEEDAIARALVSGKMVTGFASFDDRAIERSLVRLRTARPTVLAVGSSRLQPLPATAFPGETFVNVAVQGAMLDDLLGVYGLYDVDGRRPTRVILNVDPWTQSYREEPGWGSVAAERTAVMRRSSIPVSPVRDRIALATNTFKRLASPEYLRRAIFSYRKYGVAGVPWLVADSAQNERKTKLPDGTVAWNNTPADNGLKAAPRFAANQIKLDTRLQKLDARVRGREDALERFIRYIEGTGVAVTVLLVPFPIEVYDAFVRLPGYPLTSVERDVRAMAARTGADVVGSYDPRPLGMTTIEFFDETHLRPEPLARLFSASPITSR